MRRKSDRILTLANVGLPEAAADRPVIEAEVRDACAALLDALRIDVRNDPNARDTASRMAKMYVHEVCRGRFYPPPDGRMFDLGKKIDQLYAVGPIQVRSLCSHHFAPIVGQAWVGVFPSREVLGLSKFARLVHWVMARPQIQEEATEQIADVIEQRTQARGVAVVVKATHLCMTWRGVQETGSVMTTSVMRGAFQLMPSLKAEFMELIR